MFKGTERLGPGEFSRRIDAEGGQSNAFTSWDYTAYFQRVAADRLGLMMELEADRMVNLRLDPAEVATERAVVVEERAQRTDSNPGGLFSEQRRAMQYLNHPYGRPIIGWRHEIEALTREDALDFYRAHYGPNNAVLVIAGGVKAEAAIELARTHYGPIPANDAILPRVRPSEPPQIVERRLDFTDPRVGQPYVIRSYIAPAREAGEQAVPAALTVLADVLGGTAATSVLGRALEFEGRIAVQTGAYYDATALDGSLFTLVVVPAEGVTLDAAEAALDAALARFLETGVTAEELDRIKAQLRAAEIYARDSAGGLARRVGAALTTGLTLDDVEAWPEALQAVTVDDVMATARDVLDRRRAVTGRIMAEAGQ
jgi:zinc protease